MRAFVQKMRIGSELTCQLWNRIKQISNQAKIGHLENRGFFVFVDRYDDLTVFHARKVLDRTGNPDCDVKIRRNNLTGLANLPVIGGITAINRSARRANSGVQLICQLFD